MSVNREGRRDDKRENEDMDVVNKFYYIREWVTRREMRKNMEIKKYTEDGRALKDDGRENILRVKFSDKRE